MGDGAFDDHGDPVGNVAFSMDYGLALDRIKGGIAVLLPGDEIIFDRESGDFWAFVEDIDAPPAPPGVVRVTTADPRDFAGRRALVVQQVPWQTVHQYDRWMEKFHDYEDGPLDPLKLYQPVVGSEWYLVLCDDRLLYAGLVSPRGADANDAGGD